MWLFFFFINILYCIFSVFFLSVSVSVSLFLFLSFSHCTFICRFLFFFIRVKFAQLVPTYPRDSNARSFSTLFALFNDHLLMYVRPLYTWWRRFPLSDWFNAHTQNIHFRCSPIGLRGLPISANGLNASIKTICRIRWIHAFLNVFVRKWTWRTRPEFELWVADYSFRDANDYTTRTATLMMTRLGN